MTTAIVVELSLVKWLSSQIGVVVDALREVSAIASTREINFDHVVVYTYCDAKSKKQAPKSLL